MGVLGIREEKNLSLTNSEGNYAKKAVKRENSFIYFYTIFKTHAINLKILINYLEHFLSFEVLNKLLHQQYL